MRPNARWRGVACVGLLFAISISQLESAAFAQNADKTEERTTSAAADGPMQPPKTLPSRPSIKTSPVQLTALSAPTRSLQSPSAPTQSTKKRNGWKWILIAAAGAGVTAIVLANQNPPPDEHPMITLGQPVVGEPQ